MTRDRLPQTLRTRMRTERLERCLPAALLGLGPEDAPEVTIEPPAEQAERPAGDTRGHDR